MEAAQAMDMAGNGVGLRQRAASGLGRGEGGWQISDRSGVFAISTAATRINVFPGGPACQIAGRRRQEATGVWQTRLDLLCVIPNGRHLICHIGFGASYISD